MTSTENTENPENSSALPTTRGFRKNNVTDEAYSDAARPLPSLGMLLQPAFVFSTLFNFVRVWFVSRNYRLLAIGLPAVVIGLVVIGTALSVNRTVKTDEYVRNYERALQSALETDNVRGQEVALNSLLQLQPDEHRHRYNLALLRLRQERIANGLATMRSLANEKNFPKARLWLASRLLSSPDKRQIEEAIEHLKEVVKSEPENATANGLLGEIYLKLRQPSLAEPFLQHAATSSPASKLQLAECLLQLGRKETAAIVAAQAESEFRSLVGSNVGGSDPQSGLRVLWADSLRMQGRLQEAQSVLFQGLAVTDNDPVLRRAFGKLIAISATGERMRGASNVARYTELLTQALRYDTENIAVITRLAQLPLEPGQINGTTLKTTSDFLTKRIKEDPNRVEYQMLLAWVQRMEGSAAKSIATMQDVVRKRPELQLSLAQLYRLSGDSALATAEANKAFQYFKGLSEQNPKNHVNYVQMAQIHEFLGNSDAAVNVIEQANEANPHPQLTTRSIRFRLIKFDKLHRENQDRPQQLKLVDSVLAIAPDNSQAINCLGALIRTPDDSEADEVSQLAKERLYEHLTTGKNTFQIHSMLGTVAEENNDFETAAQHLGAAARLRPNDPIVCNNLAHVLANIKNADLERALDLANNALKTMPGHPEVLETRGEIYVKLERFADAQTDLEACLGKSGDVRDVHRYLASVYTGLKQPELAARHKKLSEKPDDE